MRIIGLSAFESGLQSIHINLHVTYRLLLDGRLYSALTAESALRETSLMAIWFTPAFDSFDFLVSEIGVEIVIEIVIIVASKN